MMKPASSPVRPGGARGRLLAAAARVFARDGLAGATTRAIARAAGVNEVTLFRQFKSKEGLLAAVIGAQFGTSVSPRARAGAPPIATEDLQADLLALGRAYERLLNDNLPLVRTMLGELHHHHPAHERQVFRAVFRPLKTALADRLTAARAAGDLRRDLPPELLADLFSGMLFTGVVRRASHDLKLEYSAASHLRAAVELVLGPPPSQKGQRSP